MVVTTKQISSFKCSSQVLKTIRSEIQLGTSATRHKTADGDSTITTLFLCYSGVKIATFPITSLLRKLIYESRCG